MVYPRVSFIIPIYNSAHLIKDCLKSIKKQKYPKSKIEILMPDGGSKDDGSKIAKELGAKVVNNPKILAEPGFMLGANMATGDLTVYMGADNRLGDSNWINKMIKPFEDPRIIAAFPWHRSYPKSSWLTKYFNSFTDPINHFVLGSAANALYFHRAYRAIKKNKDYVIYDFFIDNFPMLAFDQGFTVRKSYKRPKETEYDDILPVLDMIKKKMRIAFVPNASNYHITLDKGIGQFLKKMRWIIDNNISGKSEFGFPTRRNYLSNERRLRFILWPFYAASIILPILNALFGLIRDRKKEWLFHPFITYIMLFLVGYELLRIKIFRRRSLVSRQ